jgi:hypothetical protein
VVIRGTWVTRPNAPHPALAATPLSLAARLCCACGDAEQCRAGRGLPLGRFQLWARAGRAQLDPRGGARQRQHRWCGVRQCAARDPGLPGRPAVRNGQADGATPWPLRLCSHAFSHACARGCLLAVWREGRWAVVCECVLSTRPSPPSRVARLGSRTCPSWWLPKAPSSTSPCKCWRPCAQGTTLAARGSWYVRPWWQLTGYWALCKAALVCRRLPGAPLPCLALLRVRVPVCTCARGCVCVLMDCRAVPALSRRGVL